MILNTLIIKGTNKIGLMSQGGPSTQVTNCDQMDWTYGSNNVEIVETHILKCAPNMLLCSQWERPAELLTILTLSNNIKALFLTTFNLSYILIGTAPWTMERKIKR